MTADIIDVCSGMLLVGRVGEQAAGKLLYYEYAKKSPVMLDMFRWMKMYMLQINQIKAMQGLFYGRTG